MAKVKLTVYVDEEIKRLAHWLKEETGRTISHVVREAIREWARETEERKEPREP